MKLSTIKVNPRNPQKFGDLSKLENSLDKALKFLSVRPIVYDPKTMYVLGGNKRLLALQNLGVTELPEGYAKPVGEDWTEEDKRMFIITDNVGHGLWDYEILGDDYDTEELDEWGVPPDPFLDGPEDIDEIDDFNEGVNFQIKCSNLEELDILKTKLGLTGASVSFEKFLEVANL